MFVSNLWICNVFPASLCSLNGHRTVGFSPFSIVFFHFFDECHIESAKKCLYFIVHFVSWILLFCNHCWNVLKHFCLLWHSNERERHQAKKKIASDFSKCIRCYFMFTHKYFAFFIADLCLTVLVVFCVSSLFPSSKITKLFQYTARVHHPQKRITLYASYGL